MQLNQCLEKIYRKMLILNKGLQQKQKSITLLIKNAENQYNQKLVLWSIKLISNQT